MIRIINERDTGKTHELMLIAQEQGALFVCEHPAALKYKAKSYGIDNVEFISYYDFLQDMTRKKKYVVDEIEHLIAYLGGNELVGYSLTI